MLKIRPGWTATPYSGFIKFSSDIKVYKVSLSNSLIRDFFDGDKFIIPDAHLSPAVDSLVNKLNELDIISPHKDEFEGISSLQSKYFYSVGGDPESVESNLEKSHVLVLGLGGTGSIVLEHLAPSGIKNFSILDADNVEQSNLQRQFLYDQTSVGQLKTEATANYLLKCNTGSRVRQFVQKISTKSDLVKIIEALPPIDMCAICIDEPVGEIFDIASSVLWERNIPFIHGGVMIQSGFWGPLFDRKSSSPNPAEFKIDRLTSAEGATSPLKICFSPYNTIIASFMAAAILHHLSGCHHKVDYSHRTFANFEKMVFRKIDASSWKNQNET